MTGVPEAGVMIKAEEVLSGLVWVDCWIGCWPKRLND